MADTQPANDEGTCSKIDPRLWGIMQEICLTAHILKVQHEEVYKLGPKIAKSGNREEKAELDVVKSSGGTPWKDLANALRNVDNTHAYAARNGGVLVRSDDIISRSNVKAALRVLVDNMYHHADRKDLIKAGTIRAGEGASVGYRGPRLRPAMQNAFSALAEWDNYMAEQTASRLFSRMCSPTYVAPGGNNPLALPAPSMPSQHPTTPPPGVK